MEEGIIYRAVPLDHRVRWHYCRTEHEIMGVLFKDVTIPIVQRLQKGVRFVKRHMGVYDVYHEDVWVDVGIFDVTAPASDHRIDLGIETD